MGSGDPKGGESRCEYPRDVYPERVARERTALLAEHEADLRRVENDRWWRRIQALLPCTWDRASDDFEGCVE